MLSSIFLSFMSHNNIIMSVHNNMLHKKKVYHTPLKVFENSGDFK